MAKDNKTNAMRKLDSMKIDYNEHYYDPETVNGVEVANVLHQDVDKVFKTLVTVAPDKQHYVFVIPIDDELDLKKCARSVGAKSVAMIHVKELFPLTGYVRGGCTSIGMKKPFVTRIDESAQLFDRIYISAGRIGCQICLAPDDLLTLACKAEYADLTRPL